MSAGERAAEGPRLGTLPTITSGGTSRSGDDTVMENALEYLARDMGFEGRRDMTASRGGIGSPVRPSADGVGGAFARDEAAGDEDPRHMTKLQRIHFWLSKQRRWSQQQAEFALENGGVLVVDDSHVGTGASVVLGRWGCCESLNPAEPGCMLMPRHSSGVAKCSACGKLFDVEANAYAERNRLPPNCQRHRKEMQLDCAFSDGGLWPCCGTRGLSSTKYERIRLHLQRVQWGQTDSTRAPREAPHGLIEMCDRYLRALERDIRAAMQRGMSALRLDPEATSGGDVLQTASEIDPSLAQSQRGNAPVGGGEKKAGSDAEAKGAAAPGQPHSVRSLRSPNATAGAEGGAGLASPRREEEGEDTESVEGETEEEKQRRLASKVLRVLLQQYTRQRLRLHDLMRSQRWGCTAGYHRPMHPEWASSDEHCSLCGTHTGLNQQRQSARRGQQGETGDGPRRASSTSPRSPSLPPLPARRPGGLHGGTPPTQSRVRNTAAAQSPRADGDAGELPFREWAAGLEGFPEVEGAPPLTEVFPPKTKPASRKERSPSDGAEPGASRAEKGEEEAEIGEEEEEEEEERGEEEHPLVWRQKLRHDRKRLHTWCRFHPGVFCTFARVRKFEQDGQAVPKPPPAPEPPRLLKQPIIPQRWPPPCAPYASGVAPEVFAPRQPCGAPARYADVATFPRAPHSAVLPEYGMLPRVTPVPLAPLRPPPAPAGWDDEAAEKGVTAGRRLAKGAVFSSPGRVPLFSPATVSSLPLPAPMPALPPLAAPPLLAQVEVPEEGLQFARAAGSLPDSTPPHAVPHKLPAVTPSPVPGSDHPSGPQRPDEPRLGPAVPPVTADLLWAAQPSARVPVHAESFAAARGRPPRPARIVRAPRPALPAVASAPPLSGPGGDLRHLLLAPSPRAAPGSVPQALVAPRHPYPAEDCSERLMRTALNSLAPPHPPFVPAVQPPPPPQAVRTLRLPSAPVPGVSAPRESHVVGPPPLRPLVVSVRPPPPPLARDARSAPTCALHCLDRALGRGPWSEEVRVAEDAGAEAATGMEVPAGSQAAPSAQRSAIPPTRGHRREEARRAALAEGRERARLARALSTERLPWIQTRSPARIRAGTSAAATHTRGARPASARGTPAQVLSARQQRREALRARSGASAGEVALTHPPSTAALSGAGAGAPVAVHGWASPPARALARDFSAVVSGRGASPFSTPPSPAASTSRARRWAGGGSGSGAQSGRAIPARRPTRPPSPRTSVRSSPRAARAWAKGWERSAEEGSGVGAASRSEPHTTGDLFQPRARGMTAPVWVHWAHPASPRMQQLHDALADMRVRWSGDVPLGQRLAQRRARARELAGVGEDGASADAP